MTFSLMDLIGCRGCGTLDFHMECMPIRLLQIYDGRLGKQDVTSSAITVIMIRIEVHFHA